MTPTEFEQQVARLEKLLQENPAAYKQRLVALAVLGYAYLAGAIALLLALLLAMALALVLLKGVVIKLIIPLAIFTGVVLRSLWVRIAPPQGFALSPGTAPALFGRIEQLRRSLDAPPFHRVLVTDDLNAAVVQVPLLGLFGWHRNYLLLGLPLLKCLTPEQLEAVLAHEFGHLAGGHARFSNWLYRSRKTWQQLEEKIAAAGSSGALLFRRFLNWYVPYFQAWTFPLARANEYEADAVSARLTSARTAAQALSGVNVSAALLQERFWPDIHRQADEHPQPAFLPFHTLGNQLPDDFHSADGQRWLQQALQRQTSCDDTHPSLSDRLRALGQTAEVAPPAPGQSADYLLGDLRDSIIASFDARWQEQVIQDWRKHYDGVQENRRRLHELNEAAATRELEASEKIERGRLLASAGKDNDAALEQLRAAVAAHPQNAPALFHLGLHLLQRDDAQGVELLEQALQLDADALAGVCETLRDYYWARGEKELAQQWHARLVDSDALQRAALDERARVDIDDKLQPHGLTPEQLEPLVAQLRELKLRRAWLARRVLEHRPDLPQLLLGVNASGALGVQTEAGMQAALRKVITNTEFPFNTIVVILDGPFERKLSHIEDARIL